MAIVGFAVECDQNIHPVPTRQKQLGIGHADLDHGMATFDLRWIGPKSVDLQSASGTSGGKEVPCGNHPLSTLSTEPKDVVAHRFNSLTLLFVFN